MEKYLLLLVFFVVVVKKKINETLNAVSIGSTLHDIYIAFIVLFVNCQTENLTLIVNDFIFVGQVTNDTQTGKSSVFT